jgi:NADPH:quinone reductase
VGSIGIQLAKLAKLKVFATASRPESRDWCEKISRAAQTQNGAAWECRGRFYCEFCAYRRLLASDGGFGSASGSNLLHQSHQPAPGIDSSARQKRSFRLGIQFTWSLFQTPDMQRQHELLNEVASLIETGTLKSTVTELMTPINAANLRAVHAKIETGRTIGKIVLTGWN